MGNLTSVTANHLKYYLEMLPHLCFEVTEACNLHCAYCAFSDLYTKNTGRKGRPMPEETAFCLLEYLWGIWSCEKVRQVPGRLNISFYGGEPLLNFPLIQKIVTYANQNAHKINRRITFSLTTNAVLLRKYLDFFVANKFNLLISLDGDERGNGYRLDANGQPSFPGVYESVKYVYHNYPEYFNQHISFNAVLNNRNDYVGIVKFFENNFGKTPMVSPISTSNLNPDEVEQYEAIVNRDIVDYTCVPLAYSPLKRALLKEFNLKSGNVFYDYNELLYNMEKMPVLPTGTCAPFMKKLFLTVEGDILQCEKIDHSHVLGHVGKQGGNLDLEKAAARFNDLIHTYDRQCKSCKLLHACAKCVYLEAEKPCSRCKNTLSKRINWPLPERELKEAMEWIYSSKTVR